MHVPLATVHAGMSISTLLMRRRTAEQFVLFTQQVNGETKAYTPDNKLWAFLHKAHGRHIEERQNKRQVCQLDALKVQMPSMINYLADDNKNVCPKE